MHEVHTFMRLGVRPTMARTVWMFGFQRRRVRRCECEMLLPKPGPLPHTSQTEATGLLQSRRWFERRPRTPRQEQPTKDIRREPPVLISGVLINNELISGVPASGRQCTSQRTAMHEPAAGSARASEQQCTSQRPALFCPSSILSCPYDNRS